MVNITRETLSEKITFSFASRYQLQITSWFNSYILNMIFRKGRPWDSRDDTADVISQEMITPLAVFAHNLDSVPRVFMAAHDSL